MVALVAKSKKNHGSLLITAGGQQKDAAHPTGKK